MTETIKYKNKYETGLLALEEIERSIITTYRRDIWSKFIKAIKEFELIEDGDKICVCISGGKDSLLLAKLFQELRRHGKRNFDLVFLSMDPGYIEDNREKLEFNTKYLGIPVKIENSDVFQVSQELNEENPCYLCARMRRGFLYSRAKDLGANKIALGHHMDDVIETNLMNIIYAGNFKTMPPKLKADNYPGMELIRPLYYVEEKNIIRWLENTGLSALDCACLVTKRKSGSSRSQVKELVKELEDMNQNAKISIFRAAQNVKLDMCNGFSWKGKKYDFNDIYREKYGEEK